MICTINTLFGGLNVGAYYYPFSRLYVGLGGAFGADSFIAQNNDSFSAIYYRAFGEIGFRVNPSFSINATGGYASFNSGLSDSFLSGPFVGASLRFSGSVGGDTRGSAINVSVKQDSVVYPVYTAVYQNEPFGTIIIKNNDGAELRNVNVSFRAGRYTASAKLCGSVSRINRHSKMSFPLCADFSDEILKFTENGKISCSVGHNNLTGTTFLFCGKIKGNLSSRRNACNIVKVYFVFKQIVGYTSGENSSSCSAFNYQTCHKDLR